MIAIADENAQIKIIDIETKEEKLIIQEDIEHSIISFTPDSTKFLYSKPCYNPVLIEIETGSILHTFNILNPDEGNINSFCFSPNGEFLLFSVFKQGHFPERGNETIHVYNFNTLELMFKLNNQYQFYRFKFLDDYTVMVFCDTASKEIDILNRTIKDGKGFTALILDVIYNKSLNSVIYLLFDGNNLELYLSETNSYVNISDCEYKIYTGVFSPTSDIFYTKSKGGQINVWNFNGNCDYLVVTPYNRTLTDVNICIDNSGSYLLFESIGGRVNTYNTLTRETTNFDYVKIVNFCISNTIGGSYI